ncbi:MAG: hypothetical protein PHW86_06555 [Candidatus Bipolaricaulis sp.]|nr:hypothetical protein [Candidatus Bipolaricaulis sp.]
MVRSRMYRGVGCSLILCMSVSLSVFGERSLECDAAWASDGVARSHHPAIEWNVEGSWPFVGVGSVAVAAKRSSAVDGAVLPSEAELRARLAAVDAGDGRLAASWMAIESALAATRSLSDVADARTIESALESLESALDAFVAEAEATGVSAQSVRLLSRAGELERHADRLETIASRVRLYAKGAAADDLASALAPVARSLADGDSEGYVDGLRRLAVAADGARGRDLRRDAADAIRSSCDALVRRVAASVVERSLDVEGAADILGLELDAELVTARTAVAAPSGGAEALSASGSVAYRTEDVDVELAFATERVGIDDRLGEDSAKTVQGVSACAAWRVGEVAFDAAVDFERERRPFRVDAEIEQAAVCASATVVAGLWDEVADAGLASATERTLLKDLTAARDALIDGRRGDAADAIEDFIDHVESERWKGLISGDAAARWTGRAEGILPRRSVRALDLPFGVEMPVGDGEIDVDLEWSKSVYPANSALSVEKSGAAATWSTTRRGWTIDLSSERTRTRYPCAPAKNGATSELAIRLEAPPASTDFVFVASVARQGRPAAPVDDRADAEVSGAWSGIWNEIVWSLEAGEETRCYPNDPDRLGSRAREGTLEVEVPLAGGRLNVTWESRGARTSDGVPDTDTTTVSVEWEAVADDVEVSLSVAREWHADWISPAASRDAVILSAEVSIAF